MHFVLHVPHLALDQENGADSDSDEKDDGDDDSNLNKGDKTTEYARTLR